MKKEKIFQINWELLVSSLLTLFILIIIRIIFGFDIAVFAGISGILAELSYKRK